MENGNAQVMGVNTTNLDTLILDINDYAEKIKKILSDFDDLVQDNIQYFDCDVKDNFMTIHNENKYNFSIFEKNILSYATDLLAVKRYYEQKVSEIAENFNQNNQNDGR